MRNLLFFVSFVAVSLSVYSLATFAAESEPSQAQVCQTVEISELYANPMTYDGTLVCTEAFVLVSYWGVDLLEGRLAGYVHTPVDISAPISFWEALERGYRTYDRVRVSGRFTALEFCIDLYDPALPIQEQEGCMPSGFPFTFEDGVIERIEVVDPRAECEAITIDQLYFDPIQFDDKFVCVAGTAARQDMVDVLAPNADYVSYQTHPIVAVRWEFTGQARNWPLAGDEIDVAGLVSVRPECLTGDDWSGLAIGSGGATLLNIPTCASAIILEAYEVETLESNSPQEACIRVELIDLMENPLPYEAKLICSEGVLHVYPENNRQGRIAAIAPFDGMPEFAYNIVEVTGYRNADEFEAIETQSAVEFAAYVDTWEECFASVTALAVSSSEPQSDECQPFIYVDITEMAVETDGTEPTVVVD